MGQKLIRPVDQSAVVRYLASAEAHGGAVPKHLETHLSHVFIAGDRVLKLKKAVRWSMVDYGTPERREHFCRREIAVNRPFAPALYNGVVPVVTAGETFRVGGEGEGEVVDWLVEMRRFDEDHQLDVMVEQGTITPEIVDDTADAIASLHRSAPRVRTPGMADRVERLSHQLERDLVGLGVGGDALADRARTWAALAAAALSGTRGLVDRRGRHGFVRRCHGDLHLSNICLWEGRPTPFDAIEFSEEIATIDVLYDLAFVLVDLEMRGQRVLSSRLLSRYLEATRDYSGLALLPLYRSQRAMVRALTRAAKGADPLPAAETACAILEEGTPPRLVAVGGLSGTGKTTVARRLAPDIGAVVVRSDSVRKRLMGVRPEERLGETAYDAEVTAAVYRRMSVDARRALVAGMPVILDATFAAPATRQAVEELAARCGVPFVGVWLTAPAALLGERIAGRRNDASDADRAVLERQLARDVGPIGWTMIDASDGPPDIAQRVASVLGDPQ